MCKKVEMAKCKQLCARKTDRKSGEFKLQKDGARNLRNNNIVKIVKWSDYMILYVKAVI